MIALKESVLRKNVAELLVVRASGHALDSQRKYPQWEFKNNELKRLLREGIGGVILFGGTTFELEQRTKTLLSWAKKPLLLCADVEEGVGQRFEGGTWLAPPLAVGQIYQKDPQKAIAFAEQYGVCVGSQARACGLNWVLAPVCDINSNSKNPVINLRAWGEDPRTVSKLTCAFNKGLASQGVLTCAKHFPGHGDTSVDSHLSLPTINHDLRRLQEEELIPFKDVIATGADSVMSAHVLFPNIDLHYPATLSSQILTKLLREEIGFDDLVVTDALVMEAITHFCGKGEAAVLAFEAGADILMMPPNPYQAIEAICVALESGRVPMKRLEDALARRDKALCKVDHCSQNVQKQESNIDLIETDQDRMLAEELLNNSIEIHEPVIAGVKPGDINLIRIDDVLRCPFLTNSCPAFCMPQKVGYRTIISHERGISPWQDDPCKPLALERFGEGSFLLQLFVRGNPFRGKLINKEPWLATIKQLQSLNRLSGLVVYGSPYLWEELIKALDPHIPSAYSPGQMQQAQTMVLNTLLQANNSKDFQRNKLVEFTD